ncbi:hypothetical protein EV715DRAFT_196233 [Schizophyllum commune]
MTPNELKEWLETDESTQCGQIKDDGYATMISPVVTLFADLAFRSSGESVGHESGRKIVAILEKNPEKDVDQYDEEDLAHMRKVVAYCKRHLAQEEPKAQADSDSKAYKSLKNWGHDAQKA